MEEKYNSIIERLDNFREKFPNIVNLWDDFLKKKHELFLQNLNKAEYFLNNCETTLKDDLKPETITLLYLFFNNSLNEI
jgi:aminopeptidase C